MMSHIDHINQGERQRKINEIWDEIHGIFKSVFLWMDDTETEYHYDAEKDAIVSDNGFSVPVSLPTEEISRDYINNLIDQLEGDIYEYYYRHNIIL